GDVLQVLRDVAENTNVTMLIVTHEMSFARDVSHRVMMFDGGEDVESNDPETIVTNPSNERTRQYLYAVLRHSLCCSSSVSGNPVLLAIPRSAAAVRIASTTRSSGARGVGVLRQAIDTVRMTGWSSATIPTPSGTISKARSDTNETPKPPATITSAVDCSSTVCMICGSNPWRRQASRIALPKCEREPAKIQGCSLRSVSDTVAPGMLPAGTAA